MGGFEPPSEKVHEYASTMCSPLFDLKTVGGKRAKSY